MSSQTPPPFAHDAVIALGSLPSVDDVPGITAQETQFDGRRWAIVEYAPAARREEWCEDGHAGFVLEGEIEYEFANGDPSIVVSAGDGFTLATGRGHRGRNTGEGRARLFLIDDPA